MVNDDEKATIAVESGISNEVIVPSNVNSVVITKIEDRAFENNRTLV